MRFIICLITCSLIVLLAGCTGAATATTTAAITSAATPSAATPATVPAPGITTTAPPSTMTVPAITTTATTTSSTSLPITATTPVATAPETTSTAGSNKDDLSAYLGALMPVVQRHNATKQATTEVEVTFTFANPGMESIEAYRNALAALQPAVESELADASAIVPPAAQSAFHASVINAISLHQDGMNGNIVYYTNVLDTGTGELEALVAANDAFLEANRLWSQEILPQLEALVAEAGS